MKKILKNICAILLAIIAVSPQLLAVDTATQELLDQIANKAYIMMTATDKGTINGANTEIRSLVSELMKLDFETYSAIFLDYNTIIRGTSGQGDAYKDLIQKIKDIKANTD